MHISKHYLQRTRAERYREAFTAYERRCAVRNSLIHGNICARIHDRLGDDIRLLDIGVGNGSSAGLAHSLSRSVQVTAVDIDPNCFPQAARSFITAGIHDMRFMVGDMCNTRFMHVFHNSFDLVLVSNVLYRHATNQELLLNLCLCCRKQGLLVIVHAPSSTPWISVLSELDNWGPHCYGSEQLLLTLDNLREHYDVDTVEYPVNVSDILEAQDLDEEQTDFVLWLLPRSIPLTVELGQRIRTILRRYSHDGQVRDKRNIIVIERGQK